MHVQYYIYSCLVMCFWYSHQTIVLTGPLFILHFSFSFPLPKLVIQGLVLSLFTNYSSFSLFFFPLKGEQDIVNSPSSDILENLYLADPDTTIQFQVGLYYYQLNFKGTHIKGSYLQINCFTKINLQAIPDFQIYDLLYQCYQIYLVEVR